METSISKYIFYFIGFCIYLGFCILTFEVYSKKKEMTKIFSLIFIYIYYSILAVYVINLININEIFMEKLVDILIFIISAGFLLSRYYKKHIKFEDDELYGQNV